MDVHVLLQLLACGSLAAAAGGATAAGRVIHVAPDGSDSNSGSAPTSALASCAAAARLVAESCSNLPHGGIEVRFAPGQYKLTRATACGSISCRASADAPIVFRSAGDGEVVFDAAARLESAKMHPVTNATVRPLLNAATAANVRALAVDAASGWTGGAGQTLQWGELPLTPSVWPNTGLGYIKRIFDVGSVYCPGRTKGSLPVCQVCIGNEKSSPSKPCGANFSLSEAPTGDWERELLAGPGFGGKQVFLDGYIGADWFHESHTIVRVVSSSEETTIQLGDSSHYGICEAMEGPRPSVCGSDNGGAPGRFHVRGLLSNVDTPGEWFLDRATMTLYLIPPESPGQLGFWAGPGLISVVNSSHVTVRDLTVIGSTSSTGALRIAGGENNTIGGCTVRSCVSGIALSGGHRNTAIGNDVYDVTSFHISTSGNDDETLAHSQHELVPTNNLVANNQFTQVYLPQLTWAVHAGGMGDRFSHNVIHDAPGQVILAGGPLTIWDRK
jgi:parallel beta-helix repeat protein